MNLGKLLADPRRFEAAIDRLHRKYGHSHRLYELAQDGVPLSTISLQRSRFARLLARAVARGEYQVEPARTRWIRAGGKPRLLYDYRITDRIVHGAVASAVSEAISPFLSSRLYSYLKGVKWTQAVFDFARHVRVHRRSRPDPRSRGLYVLRRDVRQYTDSIPLGERSALWPLLEQALLAGASEDPRRSRHWELVRKVVRTEFHAEGDGLATRIRGVPTGSPIANPVFNFYLTPLDRELAAIPGAFYTRYCDDFLFAHPDAEVARRAARSMVEILTRLGLEANPTKALDLYFNGAARRSNEWPEARPTAAISFLGCEVTFRGTVRLTPKKVRRLLRDLRVRIRRTLELANSRCLEADGPLACATINAALNPAAPFAHRSAILLRSVVNDRSQLRDLDHRIARLVLRALTGTATVRAFRRVPFRRLRQEWGLNSLYHLRNRHGRR